MPTNRKVFLQQLGTGALAAGMLNFGFPAGEEVKTDPNDFIDGAPDDEKYWKRIAKKYYEVSDDYINLENGYFGLQSKPVLRAFLENTAYVNKELARFARKEYPTVTTAVKKQLADFLQVSDEELIITRNATEALNIAIQGYPFNNGDEVLLCQLDYFSMIETFRMLESRGKIKVNAIDLPLLPASEDELVELYRRSVTDKTRLILLTHVSNINGLIVPVAKIAAMAKERGIDTITDSAHALGHIPFNLRGLGSDFVGMNLHKWIGNPIGAGVLYIRKERIPELNPLFGDVNAAPDSIAKLSHFGTTPMAVIMTIPESLSFQNMLGINNILLRLRYLTGIWMNQLNQVTGVEIVTPAGAGLSCAIASYRIKNKTVAEVSDYLFKNHRILTVGRSLGKEGCVRVTPHLYTSKADIEKFVSAVREYAS